ncbi:MAG: bifunctional phosphopantothenoylcysteine decarboxylase/phosphopantothenate--cysteine ligase CoaBC [Flavobacteriaceae bacterium]|nr:bifunctional phosphopantothenoylcysteine decarboxylase/phosphopantothenate--cysteine ligase CoaBC [Flavobacteriaceae bacterium]
MTLLGSKKILLGISGGIAAYKTPLLVRVLINHGAEVKVIMTPSAKDFVTPLTLSTLSKNTVLSTFISEDQDNPTWNDHVALAQWADLVLIAPATSNTISSMVHGRCNNLLIATYLSAKCPVFIAPAMDLDMYSHSSNQKNMESLIAYGNHVLPVGEGFLASGLEGKGRMLEPNVIASYLVSFFNPELELEGKKVLITAGPTYEAIDPVRFIGNHSSGKMGYALAEAALKMGAEVILISGPSSEKIKHASLELVNVVSAKDMAEAVKNHYDNVDLAIASAAVSDFKPKKIAPQKLKKQNRLNTLTLTSTEDILAYMGKYKKKQIIIGFALETENELENAKFKLVNKNLDGIVLNSLRDSAAGFSSNTNKITFIHRDLRIKTFPLQSKLKCAYSIFDQILSL